jgi:hypothetical protein
MLRSPRVCVPLLVCAQEVKGREALDKGARVSFASVEEKGLRSSF